jgi:hypothetical protein
MVQELRHDRPLFSCRFDPSGRFVFAGAQDNTVQRWDLATGRRVSLVGHRSWIRGLAFLRESRTLVSGSYDGRLIFWPADAETPTPARTIDAHQGWVRAVAVSPDGRTVASCGNDNLVKLWSAQDGSAIRTLEGHGCHVYNVAFHPSGHLVSGDLRGVVKEWDCGRGTLVRNLDASALYRYDTVFRADIGGVRSMTFNPDGSLLVCSGITEVTNAFAGVGRPGFFLFDWASGRLRHRMQTPTPFQGTGWGVDVHPLGFLTGVAGGGNGMLYFWRPRQAMAFHALGLPTNARDVHLHRDGLRLAVAFFDGAVRIYDMSVPPRAS